MDRLVYTIKNSIYINLTNECSNDCIFCIRNGNDFQYDNMWMEKEHKADEYIKELNKYNLSNYKELVYCGFGEPTYKLQEIKEISNYIKKFNIKTRINTNGQANLIHGRDVSKDLVESVDIINISLNEVDRKNYQAICKSIFGEKAYDSLLEFAKSCIKYGGDVILSIVDIIDQEKIEKAKKLADSIGAKLRIREYIK